MQTLQCIERCPAFSTDAAERVSRALAAAVVADGMTTHRVDAVHSAPVWRDRANFIIGAPLPEPGRAEQLWTRQVGDRRFEICCIPFFVYDVALGDIVETDGNYDLVRVIVPSGRFAFRVWFGESSYPREAIAEELSELGALLEWSSANLLAVDAADAVRAQRVADYLAEQQGAGRLMYETGRS